MNQIKNRCILLFLFAHAVLLTHAQQNLIPVAKGWAGNSINAVVFRKNSLVTYKDIQFIAYYNPEGKLMIGKRKLQSSTWELAETSFKGNIRDAHNSISIMVDGDGFLHVAWDHHGNALNYARSVKPCSLQFTGKISMTGQHETNVTYPEFYKMPKGDLVFLYRDGQSGKGNLVFNYYDVKTKTWNQRNNDLIDGEGRQNAYWQACVDHSGTIHISWVWRSSPNVASNHDMCYARSSDGGKTWEKSSGEKYSLPLTVQNAEYAFRIPQNSELINQTSMTTDESGNPFIATYWRSQESVVPQYHVLYNVGKGWKELNAGFRTTPFVLSGAGTKSIPVSRPQVLVNGKGENATIRLLFRDKERGSKVSMAICTDILLNKWKISDLTSFDVGEWEPSYDTELLKDKKQLHIFVQRVEQVDSEGIASSLPEMVNVLETK